jgi:predicted transcriptional regulator
MELKLLRLYGLRPLELLVFHVVALATVQKTMRDVRHPDTKIFDVIPHDVNNGTISRRRIADVTELPRTTVARVLDKLKDRGMVIERARGRLQVPVGVALQGRFEAPVDEIFAPILTLFGQFYRLGIVDIRSEQPAEF